MFEPKGIIVPVVTPFDRRDALDERAFREFINFTLHSGIHGVFAAGSQGEFWTLSKEEKRRLFEIAVDEVNGRVPVYAGTGAESTKEVVELTEMAKDVGADAVSIITPYFIRPDSDGLFEHYRKAASSVDIPVVVYTNPARTGGVTIAPDHLVKLGQECSNVVAIKDSSGDLSLTLEYITRCGKGISVLAGRDSIIFHTLVSGGRGAVSACANVIPRLLVSLYDAAQKGDYQAGLELQQKVSRLRLAFELGVFPEVIKEAVNIMGFDVGHCRMPVTPMRPENRSKLAFLLKDLDVLAGT